MKQQQYLRLFIAQDAEKDNLYNYSHLYLQQHVYKGDGNYMEDQ